MSDHSFESCTKGFNNFAVDGLGYIIHVYITQYV